MQYLAMVYEDETTQPAPGTAEFETWMDGYRRFGELAGAAIVGGNALLPTTTATTVRVSGDETLTTDGPFAETKEHLGGYYVLECADLDAAIALAAHIPAARTGSIEVRPVMAMEDASA